MSRGKNLFVASLIFLALVALLFLFAKPSDKNSSKIDIPKEDQSSSYHAENTDTESVSDNPTNQDVSNLEKDVASLSQNDFYEYSQGFLESLPTLNELQKIKKHSVHPKVADGYKTIGQISRAAIKNQELREIGLSTLEQCANLVGYPPSIRALCLRHHRKIRAATQDTNYDESSRIKDLDQLSKLLLNLPN